MAFTIKEWFNELGSGTDLDAPDETYNTPIDAEALRDLEDRLTDYTDLVGGNARVLLWNATTLQYEPVAYQTSTVYPREFIGPVDPVTITAIDGPIYGDRWTPTAGPIT